ncbi:MAG: peptidylprolyl isomerase [Winogradskyella sp.]|uniref:peptidylprolyl isomerase n=1 Tax=Winogradskyella sp. TaxID=1883156 RepID=UPI0017DABE8D|nr:peptidylprolyl isomerase [Winogradskyella sp.]
MRISFKTFLIVLFVVNVSFSQNEDNVLLTVDGTPIDTSEFLRVYNKNLDLVKDENQKDIDGYLKLFIDYQLKLNEAKRLKLDEDPKYQREFLSYKKQLTRNYLSENKVTDALVKEAYERSKLDIKASHILVRIEESSKDTLEAFNKLLALKERVQSEGFENVKADVHDGKTIFLEDLGYFSAFKMVYDFESVAFKTAVGEMSDPFRTQFGYHVVKVEDKRPSRGTITAAHIMVGLNQKDSLVDPEKRINDIYKRLQQGEDFESLAKQFSDDKSSAKNGGKLTAFKSGQLSSVIFEDKAFSLKEDGQVTMPFKSEYGWHIVKRLDLTEIESFENLKPEIESRVKRDTRSKLINTAMVEQLKKRYDITYNDSAIPHFETIISNQFFSRSWKLPEELDKDEMLFKINDKVYTYYDFGRHLMAAQRQYAGKVTSINNVVEKEFNAFFDKTILNYRKENLELENTDFANILKEYRDGLLLFELMEREIWNKASKDSLGLENYYNSNRSKYQWPDRVDVVMASTADKFKAKQVLKMMKKGLSEEKINTTLNTEAEQNVIFTKGAFNISDSRLPNNLELKLGLSGIYEHNDAYHVIDVKSVLPAGQKSLEEARGSVINDFQTEIEDNWMEDLRDRMEVEINEEALRALKAKINKQ